MKILKTMLLNAASLLGVYMLGLFILYLALDGQLDRVPDWSVTVMLIPAVILWALLSPWKLIGLERRSEDNERLQTLLEQATTTAMEMQDRYRAVLNLIAAHFCAKGEHLPGEPDDHGIVYCAACDEILNADDPNDCPCCGGEDCGKDTCESCGACAPAEENRE